MARYLTRRAATTALTLFGIVIVVFFVVRILPGDAAALRAGPYADAARLAQVRDQYGLDPRCTSSSAPTSDGVAHGDLGHLDRLRGLRRHRNCSCGCPPPWSSVCTPCLLACLIGIPMGIIAAARQGRLVDRLVRAGVITGSSMALFWLGLLLIYFFFYRLRWFPAPIDRLPVGVRPAAHLTGLYTVDALLTGQARPRLDGCALADASGIHTDRRAGRAGA